MSEPQPDLSIVIPAFNEEKRLPPTFEKIAAWLRTKGLSAEVIVVDDGSTDGTARVAEEAGGILPGIRVLRNGRNYGKGYSVRHGMREARGRVALFTDADLSAPIEEADKLLAALETAEVAFGSRALDRRLITVHESRFREVAGILFNKMVKVVLWIPFVDTQCGFKAFRMERARMLFEQQRIERFGFDPELLYLARHHGLRAVEIPVRWAHDPRTKVNMMRDSVLMFAELLTIRWNAICGRYRRRGSGE
ncbi:MAG TPA: dolichyl-phosphate beta-glucosyltransferase [Candidatus Acidoferrales bacterium]|nr:dolichyl-phosphate beta-glucosyltransferase [Candidatus Acidoferrales bacterium]